MKGSRGTKGQMKNFAFENSKDDVKKTEAFLSDMTNKLVNQGLPLKEVMGVNARVLEGMYAQAYRLYNTGKYVEATHIFRLLILMDPTESKYMLGLAACHHMLKEYNSAIQLYTTCCAVDPNTPVPFYHISDCFIQMKDFVSAAISLEMTISKAGNRSEYAKLKERAVLSLESIKKQLESGPASEPI